MFGFVRLVAKPFMRPSDTTPSIIAGMPSSLQDWVRGLRDIDMTVMYESPCSYHCREGRGQLFSKTSVIENGCPGAKPVSVTGSTRSTSVVSRIFRTFNLAERHPALGHVVTASLICWSLASSMLRYLFVDHANRRCGAA